MTPILYSFRRCPYAMLARLAIKASKNIVELREVVLKNKPEEMLKCSPKATVPVLVLPGNQVIDESFDIMVWALQRHDPCGWLDNGMLLNTAKILVNENDNVFKQWLDRYKYHDRYPEYSMEHYRSQGEIFLQELNHLLGDNLYLMGKHISFVDIAIFPFIRQFANTDKDWFYSTTYIKLQSWLDNLIASPLFDSIMYKYKPWKPNDDLILF